MESEIEENNQKKTQDNETLLKSLKPKTITYWQLGCLILVFLFGATTILIFQNVMKSEIITFSTIDLVSFLFSMALAGASIVLAITAINLGKASERAMINRSDESIRLQNEVFVKTIDALQRIESSTGVTEKRIEDIISGRAGDISQRVAERAFSGKMIKGQDRKQLEEEIRKSLLVETSESTREQRQEAEIENRKRIEEANRNYEQFKTTILLRFANNPIVRSEKIGDGFYGGSKEELADGIFVAVDTKFAICTFPTDELIKKRFLSDFRDLVNALALEISRGTFEKVFLIFDCKLTDDNEFYKQFNQAKETMRESIVRNLSIVSGSPEEIEQNILSVFQRK